jgi:hypothetical protein
MRGAAFRVPQFHAASGNVIRYLGKSRVIPELDVDTTICATVLFSVPEMRWVADPVLGGATGPLEFF